MCVPVRAPHPRCSKPRVRVQNLRGDFEKAAPRWAQASRKLSPRTVTRQPHINSSAAAWVLEDVAVEDDEVDVEDEDVVLVVDETDVELELEPRLAQT